MNLFITLLASIAAGLIAYGAYSFYKNRKAIVTKVASGPTAFAKLAEADGKLIALKVATDAKKAEAVAAHDAIDEVHKLLG